MKQEVIIGHVIQKAGFKRKIFDFICQNDNLWNIEFILYIVP